MSSPYALKANNNFSRTEYIHSCVDLKLSLLSIRTDTHLIKILLKSLSIIFYHNLLAII